MISSNIKFKLSTILLIIPFITLAGLFWVSTSNQPLVDQHEFRQCQTALTAYWFDFKNPIRSVFFYETPVFGYPWQTPFEFPIYQIVVAIFSALTDLPLTQTGRLVSAFMFLACLLPLHSISKGLKLGNKFYIISSIVIICSPFYLYWSRAFLIESTALFFGFAFLAFYLKFLNSKKWPKAFWILAVFSAILCALCKITTFPTFGLAAAGLLVLQWKNENEFNITFKKIIINCFNLFTIGLIAIVFALLWTRHADQIKDQGLISSINSSQSLLEWNFGTFNQRLDFKMWIDLFVGRSFPFILGSPYVLFGFILAPLFLTRQAQCLLIFLILLYLLPFIVFTNLYYIHDYYQYANAIWLLLALAYVYSEASKKIPLIFSLVLLLLTIFVEIRGFYIRTFPHFQTSSSDALIAGSIIKNYTSQTSCILVFGEHWNPRLAFYSERKAIYIPDSISGGTISNILLKLLNSPSELTGDKKLEVIVFNKTFPIEKYPADSKVDILKFIEAFKKQSKIFETKDYRILVQNKSHSDYSPSQHR
jgi:hypothetical protein